MRRVAELYLVVVFVAGALFVAGFSLVDSTPPRWALGIVFGLVVVALAAFLYLKRVGATGQASGNAPQSG